MAIIQLPAQESIGGALGAGLGSGFSSGISNLIDMKMKKMEREQEQQGMIEGLQALGYSPDEASQLSTLPPQLLNLAVKEKLQESTPLFKSLIAGAEVPPAEAQGLVPGLAPPTPEAAVIPGVPTSEAFAAATAPPVPEVPVAEAEQLPTEPAVAINVPVEADAVAPSPESLPVKLITPTPATADKLPTKVSQASKISADIDRMKNAILSGGLKRSEVDKISSKIAQKEDILTKLIVSENQIQAVEKRFEKQQDLRERKFKLDEKKYLYGLSSEERKEKRADQKDIDRETVTIHKKILKSAKATKMNEMRLERMAKLNEDGFLGSQLINSLISTVGKGIGGKLLGNIGLNIDC